jgi:hypothetical protein
MRGGTESTSHLAGLWIGAVISNTSHSNKAGSTTAKRARVTGKEDQGRRQCCHTKHKKFPYRTTRDVSSLSRHDNTSNGLKALPKARTRFLWKAKPA